MPEGKQQEQAEQKPSWYGNVPLDASGLKTTMMKQFLELKSSSLSHFGGFGGLASKNDGNRCDFAENHAFLNFKVKLTLAF